MFFFRTILIKRIWYIPAMRAWDEAAEIWPRSRIKASDAIELEASSRHCRDSLSAPHNLSDKQPNLPSTNTIPRFVFFFFPKYKIPGKPKANIKAKGIR